MDEKAGAQLLLSRFFVLGWGGLLCVWIMGCGSSPQSETTTLSPSGCSPSILLGEASVCGFTQLNGTVSYWGIRYAMAERFQLAEISTPPSGSVINASKADDHKCPQSSGSGSVGVEDCLFLDITVPMAATPESGLAVMVWIHPGGLVAGSKHNYSPWLANIVPDGNVAMVSINYRVGAFGFFSDVNNETQSNLGIHDQITALQWVQTHIASFGGDPNRVTIFGSSSGALSVMVLHQSPLAKGLFHRAIAQSPAWQDSSQFHYSSNDSANGLSKKCLENLHCEDVACLRAQSVSDIVVGCPDMFDGANFLSTVGAVFTGYDGLVLPQPLYEKLCGGEETANAEVPILVGSNLHEWRFFQHAASASGYNASDIVEKHLVESLPGYAGGDSSLQECVRGKLHSMYSSATAMQQNCSDCSAWYDLAPEIQLATDLDMTIGAILQSQAVGGARYRYLFDVEVGQEAMGSAHGWEIYYLTSDPASLDESDGKFPEEKRTLARQIHEYWYTFAKTGVPSNPHAGGPEWSPVQAGSSLPMMRLRLPMAGGSAMQATNWFSDETANLLQGLACGKAEAQQSLLNGCEGEGLNLLVVQV